MAALKDIRILQTFLLKIWKIIQFIEVTIYFWTLFVAPSCSRSLFILSKKMYTINPTNPQCNGVILILKLHRKKILHSNYLMIHNRNVLFRFLSYQKLKLERVKKLWHFYSFLTPLHVVKSHFFDILLLHIETVIAENKLIEFALNYS